MSEKSDLSRITEFLTKCVAEMEADGYQTWEGDDGEVSEDAAPDDWGHNGPREMWFRFKDGETWIVKATKRRK